MQYHNQLALVTLSCDGHASLLCAAPCNGGVPSAMPRQMSCLTSIEPTGCSHSRHSCWPGAGLVQLWPLWQGERTEARWSSLLLNYYQAGDGAPRQVVMAGQEDPAAATEPGAAVTTGAVSAGMAAAATVAAAAADGACYCTHYQYSYWPGAGMQGRYGCGCRRSGSRCGGGD